ncbi:glycosyl transferase [Vulcanisaeta sp. EB80]|uniref:glycosyltransferase n=1 Tax=Vulcanisaeta sp. EB80 TaxID=1650660 RepID=UPI0009BE943D|nr:glycosyltransferase [Vulcanisaeta sp. EB80]PLC68376.1 glycosyl transferase [Vulcanisaeta sp. EB80]
MAYSVVSHHYWGSPGGGQLVCASAAVALDSVGLEPILTGTFKFDPGRYVDWYGIDISRFRVYTLMPVNIKAFGLWTRLYMWRPAKKVLDNYDTRVMFIDEEAYKPLVGYRSRGLKIVEYVHFPFEVVVDPRFRGSGLAYGEDPYIMERYGKFPMNIYWGVFTRLLPRYLRENPFRDADLVLTNSRWTAGVVKMVYGEEPVVLNPPIPPNMAIVGSPKPLSDRLPLVVMLGRFSEEKRYHWVVTELMPRLVREFPSAKLVIFGGATTRTQLGYVNRVADLARRAGFGVKVISEGNVINELDEEHQVYLRLNAPRAEINETMDRARVFLHATINEHWGIAVAEAMARGLPVVVHRSGGAWSDLAMNGEVGLGYEGVDEAVEALAKLLTDEKAWGHYSGKSLGRVGEITFDKFVSRLSELVKRLA